MFDAAHIKRGGQTMMAVALPPAVGQASSPVFACGIRPADGRQAGSHARHATAGRSIQYQRR
jgi:hypothetical protein